MLAAFLKIDLWNKAEGVLEFSWEMFRIVGFVDLSDWGFGSGPFSGGSGGFGVTSHILIF